MTKKLLLALIVLLGLQCASFAETPSYIQVAPDGTGKKVDQAQITYGGNTVYRQGITLGDPTTGANLAAVDSAGRLNVAAPNVTLTQTPVSVGTSSTALLSLNTSRKYAFIENTTSTPAYISIGTSATSGTGIYLGPTGSYEFSSLLGNVDTRAINAISTSGSINILVLEGQ